MEENPSLLESQGQGLRALLTKTAEVKRKDIVNDQLKPVSIKGGVTLLLMVLSQWQYKHVLSAVECSGLLMIIHTIALRERDIKNIN